MYVCDGGEWEGDLEEECVEGGGGGGWVLFRKRT